MKQTKIILNAIKLSYNVNLQFIEDQLIEINPRVSSFIFQDNLIFPYLAIKIALGELSPSDLKKRTEKIAYGRRMLRYMDQIFWEPWEDLGDITDVSDILTNILYTFLFKIQKS